MHIVSRTITHKFKKLKLHKKILLEIFSLLCLSRDLESFEIIYRHLCVILTTQSLTMKNKEIISISDHISNINIECRQQINDEAETDLYDNTDYDNFFFNSIETQANYSKSPFYHKFNKDTSIIEIAMEKQSSENNDNDLFCPEFLNHILTL